MKRSPQKLTRLLFALLLILMMLPGVLMFVPATRGKALFGIQEAKIKERAPIMYYLDKHDDIEQCVKQRVGFCNHGVRLYNELNYRLFHYSSAPKLIIGQDDYFYENIYLNEYTGQDFVGEDVIKNNILQFKQLQDSLHERGIELLLVLEPGKARCMPEHLPRRCRKGSSTNYELYARHARECGVRMLDLDAWFQSIVAKESHPLYARHGIHWSTYGMWRAADTLQHFIERECGTKLSSFRHLGDSISTLNKDLDFDLEPPMNLMSELDHERLCFPIMEPLPQLAQRPRTLIVADSYVWSLWDHGIIHQWFEQPEFWYYNNTVYPDIWEPTARYVDKSQLAEKLKNKDVILLMITDANLRDFGWGLVHELHELHELHGVHDLHELSADREDHKYDR